MNKIKSSSDSESDEDYLIDDDNAASGSSDDTDDCGSEASENSNNKYSKKTRVNIKPEKDPIEKVEISAHRQTRQSAAPETSRRSSEKEELQSDEEADKTRSDTLWADFLSDVGSERLINTKTNYEESTGRTAIHVKSEALEHSRSSPKQTPNGFEKLLDVKKNYSDAPTPKVFIPKRPSKNSSVNAVLNRFQKKKKMSVLEKSQVDWKNFKNDEGIDEELRTHNKGKDGYLERQDFLQRTDVRQFEIEKNLRQSSRQN